MTPPPLRRFISSQGGRSVLSRSSRGFSLTEMVVVLAILMLLMAIIIPIIGPMRRQGRMKAGCAAVAGALRTARSMAIAQSAIYKVDFETSTDPDEVRIYSGTGSKSKPDRIELLPERVDFYPPSLPADGALRFQPDGSCSGSFTVTIRGEKDDEYRIKVSPANGRVSVERVTN